MAAQTATIVVTDLVGSTALRSDLGEEQAEELRRDHDHLLADVATSAGGTVIKGLGDGVLVSFPGAAEAVGAAVSMQQGVESLGRRRRLPLAIRVGVSSGDVTFEDGDSFGTPVVEASRLCSAAGDGQILVADVVRVLARGRGGHEVVPVGALELKGLPEPVDAHEVRWEPVRSPGDLRVQSPYVGRAAERETLASALAAAADGHGGLVLVVGEPGIGKTRLVTEALADTDASVLLGGCHDGETSAYLPFVEALTDWVRRVPVDRVSEVLGPQAAVVARLVPAVRDVLPDVGEPVAIPAEDSVARLSDAVDQVFQRLASAGPVVLVLDDLHWADEGTVALLRTVARRARHGALLVVATYRDTDLDRRHPLADALPVLRREVEPTRIDLAGLVADDVRELLERLADHDVPPAFADLLARQTDGNPFFLREMLLHLTSSGLLRFEDGAWVADDELATVIPEGIREVVGRRLSQLSGEANRLLGAAALFEGSFLLPVAAEVAGLGEDDALDAIDEALAARMVVPGDQFDAYDFTHALFRQTLLGELSPSRQVRMHRAVAEALEKLDAADPAAMARHWHLSAALPGAERGVPHALAQAEAASDRFAHREAYVAYRMALDLLPIGDERRFAILEAATDSGVLGEADADDLVDLADELGAEVADEVGADAAADRVAAIARRALTDQLLSWRLATVARRWLDPDRRDIVWVLLRGLELDEADFADPDQPGITLDSPERREVVAAHERLPVDRQSPYLVGPSSREAALRYLAEWRPEFSDHPWPAMWVAGEYRRLVEHVGGEVDGIRDGGGALRLGLTLSMVIRSHTVLGDHDRSDEYLAEGMALLDRIPLDSNAAFQLFAAHRLQGFVRGRRMEPTALDVFDNAADQPGTRWASLAVEAANATILARANAPADEVVETVSRLLSGIERAPGFVSNYPYVVCSAVDALWHVERTDHLDPVEANLRTKVLEPDLRYAEVDSRWAMARVSALRGDIDEARRWFADARRVLGEQGCGPLLVAVDHDEAVMEVRLERDGRGGDRARFDECVASARAGCDHPAMDPWRDRLDELIAARGTL